MIELAIVLTIIGLLLGGVLAGRSLVKSAELRANITQAQRYLSALKEFKARYNYLPSDLPNATSYWSGATNGSASGRISDTFQAWYQLSSSGLIDGTWPAAFASGYFGVSLPPAPSAPNNAGYILIYQNGFGADTDRIYNLFYKNVLLLVAANAPDNSTYTQPSNGLYTAEDALALDRKIDDGMPATGTWIAALDSGISTNKFGNAAAGVTSSSNADTTGTYRVTAADKTIYFMIETGY